MGVSISASDKRGRSQSHEELQEDDPRGYWKQYEWPIGQSIGRTLSEEEVQDELVRSCCCMPGRSRSPPEPPMVRGEAGQIPKNIKPEFTEMWDVDDAAFLDKVCCECLVKVTRVDPKESRFELRMKCKWTFRTLHSDEKTETKIRVPGVRLPGLIVDVNESRVWKDIQRTKQSDKTVFWRGVSLFTITGFERFEMIDFPFDRQLMSLDVFEFVWQAEKDSMDYDFSMHIVSFRVEVVSMLPEWEAATAIVSADNERRQAVGPNAVASRTAGVQPPAYANRFTVQLRLERKNWFYLIQIFGLTILITMASTIPLMMPANVDHIGDRLGLYSGGVLTLTAFKYSVGDQLPSVPYSTKFDRIMLTEVTSVIFCALEGLVAYRYVDSGWSSKVDEWENQEQLGWMNSLSVDRFELSLFCFLMFWWIGTWVHLSADRWGLSWIPMVMKFKTWDRVLDEQEGQADWDELENWEHKDDWEKEKNNGKELARLSLEICAHLARRGTDEADIDELDRLKDKRDRLEAKLSNDRTKSMKDPAKPSRHHRSGGTGSARSSSVPAKATGARSSARAPKINA